MKIYISADMEGVSGVVHPEHTGWSGRRHHEARLLMTGDINAAIDGAFAAGASEVVVCDSHSNGRNVVLEELDPRARLAWGRQNRSLGQVHGIDNSYAALVMVGFHARAGTPGVLNHTINSGVVHQFRLNGEAYGEVDINAALAGVFGVPIAFVSGDDRVVAQSKSRFPAIETVTTMESIGTYSALLHAPKAARVLVRDGVERALGRLADMTVLQLDGPYTLEIDFKDTAMAETASLVPGVEKVGGLTGRFTHHDLLEVFRAALVMITLGATERWETTV
ncbi:MAG: M55 family metallopeptidase [Truepera sp.]|nr:M55 family metallopeptidase [Truepera sp.]